MSLLPSLSSNQNIRISAQGMQYILKNFDSNVPQRNFVWCVDYKVQLPIRMKKQGPGSQQPYTVCQMWNRVAQQFGPNPALHFQKSQNNWQSVSFNQYYDNCRTFAKALIGLKITPKATVNIIGFNSPQWAYAFYGSIFGSYLPIGIYTTNGPEACQYIANHSQCEVVVVQNQSHLAKYIKIRDKTPMIKYYFIYKDSVPANLPAQLKGKVFSWNQVQKIANNLYKPKNQYDFLQQRMRSQKPGQCCTFIYTSGTTGSPKAVMISHDNYTWTADATSKRFGYTNPQKIGKGRALSLLPLSHVAAQLVDLVITLRCGFQLYFSDASALQGNLVKFLLVCKPTHLMVVPRVWQKIEQKMIQVGSQTTGIKRKLADWAKAKSPQGTYAQFTNKQKPFMWGVAKFLIFNKIKKGLGLEECEHFMFSAAPLRQSTRLFFLNINFLLQACYGMSQVSGPHTFTQPQLFDSYTDKKFLRETGKTMPGLQLLIQAPDKEGNGQICMRGRNRFMGYFKNEEQTRKTIDNKGFIHSGDIGQLDKYGNLAITGRIKQLIITAGGQNVAPVLIQNQIITDIPIFAHVVVIGDKKKFLTALVTLKMDNESKLAEDVIKYFSERGSNAKTIQQAMKCPNVKKIIEQGINKANQKAISKAQRINKFTILPEQFSVDSGQLTPTLKLKRKVISQKYEPVIDTMYADAKL